MRSNIKPENRRLLEAIEYIDGDIVLGVLGELKPPKENNRTSYARFRHLKHIALIAACALLFGAIIPVVNLVLPMLGITTDGGAAAGESSDKYTYTDGNFTYTKPFGEVPAEFKTIVEQNTFLNARVFGDKLYRYQRSNGKNIFDILNYSGEKLGEVILPTDIYGPLSSSHTTHNGNIIAVFYCPEHSSCQHTRLIEFNAEGNILSDILLENVTPGCFEYGFLSENGFIFVGSYRSQTAVVGKKSIISIIEVGQDLSIEKKLTLGEDNDHNILRFAEYGQDKLSVYFRSSNKIDTNNYDVVFYQYDFDTDLNLIEKSVKDKDSIPSKADALAEHFEGVNSERVAFYEIIEYENFDLLVTECGTSNYNEPITCTCGLEIQALYRETVYSAYSKDGNLLWRNSVDSTYYEEIEKLTKEHEKHLNRNSSTSESE